MYFKLSLLPCLHTCIHLVLISVRVVGSLVCILDIQGVKAGQRDAEVKSLKARLKASEQSAEIIKSFSSPQVCIHVYVIPWYMVKGR